MGLTDFPWPILPREDADYFQGVAGEVISAGQVVMRSRDDGYCYRAIATERPAEATVLGIAMNTAARVGQALRLMIAGAVIIGAGPAPPAFAPGVPYILGHQHGVITVIGTEQEGNYLTLIGVGGLRNRLLLSLFPSRQLVDF